jgi:hypothetical protein
MFHCVHELLTETILKKLRAPILDIYFQFAGVERSDKHNLLRRVRDVYKTTKPRPQVAQFRHPPASNFTRWVLTHPSHIIRPAAARCGA